MTLASGQNELYRVPDFPKNEEARVALIGPRGVGKTQFLNAVVQRRVSRLYAGRLMEVPIDRLTVDWRNTAFAEEEGQKKVRLERGDFKRYTIGNEEFQPYQRSTKYSNFLRVETEAPNGKTSAFHIADMPGEVLSDNASQNVQDFLRDVERQVRTFILFVPYWTAVPNCQTNEPVAGRKNPYAHSASPFLRRREPPQRAAKFGPQLAAWVGLLERNTHWDTCYVVLNQFGPDFRNDFSRLGQDEENALGEINTLVHLLAEPVEERDSWREGARFIQLMNRLDRECRNLVLSSEVGKTLEPLLSVTGGRSVRFIAQNTISPYRIPLSMVYHMMPEEQREQFENDWSADLRDPVKSRDLWFFPVKERLTWLPFFLASLRQAAA